MNERNSGFEILRLSAIFGILSMHVSGALVTVVDENARINITILNALFNTGVSCFVLISGYYGINYKPKKLFTLHFNALMCSTTGAVLLVLFGVVNLSKSLIYHNVVIVTTQKFWFLTSYLCLMLLSPFLNLVEKMTKEMFQKLLIALVLIFYLVPTIFIYDITGDSGKGICNVIVMYLIGRYLAVYYPKFTAWSLLSKAILVFFTIVVLDQFLLNKFRFLRGFSRDNSIFTGVLSILIFLLFSKIKFTNRLINKIASYVFCIYIIEGYIREIITFYLPLSLFVQSKYLLLVILFYALFIGIVALFASIVFKFAFKPFEKIIVKMELLVYDKVKSVVNNKVLGVK